MPEQTYLYLRRHSPGAGWAGITNCVDHISDGGIPGSAVLRQLIRHFHPVLSPSCVAKDSRSGDRFQVGLDRASPCLQLASSSSAPRARRCGKENVLDKLTFGTSCGMSKQAEPSLHEQCRYACKAEAATLFHGWHTVSAPYSLNAADVVIAKDSNILSSATRTGQAMPEQTDFMAFYGPPVGESIDTVTSYVGFCYYTALWKNCLSSLGFFPSP